MFCTDRASLIYALFFAPTAPLLWALIAVAIGVWLVVRALTSRRRERNSHDRT
jgi:hypothetical protein